MSAIECDDIVIELGDELILNVIGYKDQGESIILTIGNNKFVGVIDCYKTSDTFITKDILERLDVKRLDFLCWTHVDWDHTRGFSELTKYVKENTAIILPEGINSRLINSICAENTSYYKEEYDKIFKMFENVNQEFRLKVNQSSNIFNFNLISSVDNIRYKFSVQSFAPISGIINECEKNIISEFYDSISIHDNNKSLEQTWHIKPNKLNNLYSVGLKIILESKDTRISICLTGDLDNLTISKMTERKRNTIFGVNTIFKIPHHGSDSASELFKPGCIETFGYGVTTAYKNTLPNSKMLQKYSLKCDKLSRINCNDDNHGIITYKINFEDLNTVNVIHENSAGEYTYTS